MKPSFHLVIPRFATNASYKRITNLVNLTLEVMSQLSSVYQGLQIIIQLILQVIIVLDVTMITYQQKYCFTFKCIALDLFV